MRGKIVGDMLLAFTHADVLIAADLREHLDAPVESRSRIDKRACAIKGIRCDAVHPNVGMVGFEVFK